MGPLALWCVVVAAVPEQAAPPSVAVTADLTYAAGISPGNVVGLAGGVRLSVGRLSLGLELQFLPPGYHVVAQRDLGGFRTEVVDPRVVFGSQGIGSVAQLPVCYLFGALSACGVATVGAVSLRGYGSTAMGQWHPTVSAGLRLAGEFPRESTIRLRASAQVLGGLVRPTDGFWEASPIQLGLTLGLVFDAS